MQAWTNKYMVQQQARLTEILWMGFDTHKLISSVADVEDDALLKASLLVSRPLFVSACAVVALLDMFG